MKRNDENRRVKGLTRTVKTYSRQREERNAENGTEGGNEFARPRNWYRVAIADRTQRHLHNDDATTTTCTTRNYDYAVTSSPALDASR